MATASRSTHQGVGQLGDFPAFEWRLVSLSRLAVLVGVVAAFVAAALPDLIRRFTNLVCFGRWPIQVVLPENMWAPKRPRFHSGGARSDQRGVFVGSAAVSAPAPTLPAPTHRIPLGWLWAAPFAFVAVYLLVVHQFLAPEARWAAKDLPSIALLLFLLLGFYSVVWFGAAYLGALVLGEWGPVAVGTLLGWIPGAGRQIVVTPPARPDTRKEVWGRFGILWALLLGIELILLVLIERRGDLDLNLTAYHPLAFFTDEIVVGLLLALAIAPAAPFLAARLRIRIIDTLPFPYLWLGGVVLVLGGTTVAIVAILPGATLDPRLFLVSLLLYAPVAWYLALAFSWGESAAQRRFLRRAWAFRSPRFHFGRLQIRDEPSGEVHDA